MIAGDTSANPVEYATLPGPGRSRFAGIIIVLRGIISSPVGAIGLFLVVFHLLLAVIASFITPYDVALQNADRILQAPSWAHPMGTDSLGRDVFSRTITGGQISIIITLISAVIAALWGGIVGVSLGLVGGANR